MKWTVRVVNGRWVKTFFAPTQESRVACLPRNFGEYDTFADAAKALLEAVDPWVYDMASDEVDSFLYGDEYSKEWEEALNRISSRIKKDGYFEYDGITYSVVERSEQDETV